MTGLNEKCSWFFYRFEKLKNKTTNKQAQEDGNFLFHFHYLLQRGLVIMIALLLYANRTRHKSPLILKMFKISTLKDNNLFLQARLIHCCPQCWTHPWEHSWPGWQESMSAGCIYNTAVLSATSCTVHYMCYQMYNTIEYKLL